MDASKSWIEYIKSQGFSVIKKLNNHRAKLSKDDKVYICTRYSPEAYAKELWVLEQVVGTRIAPETVHRDDEWCVIVNEALHPFFHAGVKQSHRRSQRDTKFVQALDSKIHSLHVLGIGHGNLRPCNILVDDNMEPLIVGFSCAYNIKASQDKLPGEDYTCWRNSLGMGTHDVNMASQ